MTLRLGDARALERKVTQPTTVPIRGDRVVSAAQYHSPVYLLTLSPGCFSFSEDSLLANSLTLHP